MNKFTVIGIVIVVCGSSFVTSMENQESKSVGPDPNDEQQPEGSDKDVENAKRHLRYLYGDAYNDYFEEDYLGPYAKSFWNKFYDYIPQQPYLNPSYDTFNVPLDNYLPYSNPTSCLNPKYEDENVIVANEKPQPPTKPLKDILRLEESLPCEEPKSSKNPSSSKKSGSEYRDNLLKHVLKIVNYVQDKQTKEYNKKSSKKPKNKTKNEKPPCDPLKELKKIVECATPKCDLPCIEVNIDGKTVSKIPPTDASKSPECEEKTCNDLKKVLEIAQNCEEEEPCEDGKTTPESEPCSPSTTRPPVAHQQPPKQPHSGPKVLIEKLVLVNGQLPTQQPMNHASDDLYNSIMAIINSYTQNGMPHGNQGRPRGGSGGGLLPGVSDTVGGLLNNVNGLVTGEGGKSGNSGGLLPAVSNTVGDLLTDLNGVVTGQRSGGNRGEGGSSNGLLPGLSGTVGNLLENVNELLTGEGDQGGKGSGGKTSCGKGSGGKGSGGKRPNGGLLPGVSDTVGDLLTDLNGVVTGQRSGGNRGEGGSSNGLLPGLSGTVGDLLGNVNELLTGEGDQGGKGSGGKTSCGKGSGGKGSGGKRPNGGLLPGVSDTVGDLLTDLNGVVTGQRSGGNRGEGGSSNGLLPGLSGTVGNLLENVNELLTGEGDQGGKGSGGKTSCGKGSGGKGSGGKRPNGGLLPGVSDTVGDLLTDLNGVVTGQRSGGNRGEGGSSNGLLPGLSGTVGDLLGNVNELLTGEGDQGGKGSGGKGSGGKTSCGKGSGGKGSGGKRPNGGLLPGVSDTVGDLLTDLNGVVTGQRSGGNRGEGGSSNGLLPGLSGTVGNLLENVNELLTGEGDQGGKGSGGKGSGGKTSYGKGSGGKGSGGKRPSGGLLPGVSDTVGDLLTDLNGVVTGQRSGGNRGEGGSSNGLLPGLSGTVGDLLENVNELLTGEGDQGGKGSGGKTSCGKGSGGKGSGGKRPNGGLLPGVSDTVGDLLTDLNGVVTGQRSGGNRGEGGSSNGLLPGLSGTVGNLLENVNELLTGEGDQGGKGSGGKTSYGKGSGGKGSGGKRPSGGLLPGVSDTVGDLLTDLNGVVTGQRSGGNRGEGGSSNGLLPGLSGTVGNLLENVNELLTGEGDKGGKGSGGKGSGGKGSGGKTSGGKGSGGKRPSGGLLPGVSDTVGDLVGDLNEVLTGKGGGKGKDSNGGLLPGVSGTVGNLLGNVNEVLTGDGGGKGHDRKKEHGHDKGQGGDKGHGGKKDHGGEKEHNGGSRRKDKPKSPGGLIPDLSNTVGGLLNNVNSLLTGDDKKSEKGGGGGLLGLTSELIPKTIEKPPQEQILTDINNSAHSQIESIQSDINNLANPPIENNPPEIFNEVFSSNIETTNIQPKTDNSQINDTTLEKNNEIQRSQDDATLFAEQPKVIPHLSKNLLNISTLTSNTNNFDNSETVAESMPPSKNNTDSETMVEPIVDGGQNISDSGIPTLTNSINNFAKSETEAKPTTNEGQSTAIQPIPASISNTNNFAGAETMVDSIVNGGQNTGDSSIPTSASNTNNFANSETVAELITNENQKTANVQPIPASISNTNRFAGAETMVEPIINEGENINDSSIPTSNTNNFANTETVAESITKENQKISDVQPTPASISNTDNFANAKTMLAPAVTTDQIIDDAQPIPQPMNNIATAILNPAEEIPLKSSQPIDSPIEEENPLQNPQSIDRAVQGIPLRNCEPVELVQDIPIDASASEIEGIPIQSPIPESIETNDDIDQGNSEEETGVPDDILPPLPPPIPETDSIDQLGKPGIADTEVENMFPAETRYGFPAGLAVRDLRIEKVDYAPTPLHNEDKIFEEKLQKYLHSSNLKMVSPTSDDEEKIAFQDTQILIGDKSDNRGKQQPQDKEKEVCPFEEYAKQFRCNSIPLLTSKTGEKVQSKHMAASDINVKESQLPGDVVMLPPVTTENREIDNLPGSSDDQGFQNIGDLAHSDNNKLQSFDRSNDIPLFDDILHPGKYSSKKMIDTSPMASNTDSDVKNKEPVDASSLLKNLLPTSGEKVLNNKKNENASASQKIEEAVLPSNAVLNNLLPPKAEIKTTSRDLLSDSSLLDVVLGTGLASPLSPTPLSNMEGPVTGLNLLAPASLPNMDTPIPGSNPSIPAPLLNAKSPLPGLKPLEKEFSVSETLEKFDVGTKVVKKMLPSTKSKLAKVPLMKKAQSVDPEKIMQKIPEAKKSKNINSIPLVPPMPSSPILTSAQSTLSEISAPSMPTMLPNDQPEPVAKGQGIEAPAPEILPDLKPPMNDDTIPNLAGAQETRLTHNSIPLPENAHKTEKTKPTDGTLSQTDIWEAFLAGFSHGRITNKIAHKEPNDSSSHSSEELQPDSNNVEAKNFLKGENSPVTPSAIAEKKHSLTRRSTDSDVESRINELYGPRNWKNSVDESKSLTNVDYNQRIKDVFHPQSVKNTEYEDYDYPIASFENMPYGSQEDQDENAPKSDESSVITPDDEMPQIEENILKSRMQNKQTAIKNYENEIKSITIKATMKKNPIVDYVKNVKKPKKTYLRRNLIVDDVEPVVLGVYQENSEECTKYYRRKMEKFLNNPPNFLESIEDKANV